MDVEAGAAAGASVSAPLASGLAAARAALVKVRAATFAKAMRCEGLNRRTYGREARSRAVDVREMLETPCSAVLSRKSKRVAVTPTGEPTTYAAMAACYTGPDYSAMADDANRAAIWRCMIADAMPRCPCVAFDIGTGAKAVWAVELLTKYPDVFVVAVELNAAAAAAARKVLQAAAPPDRWALYHCAHDKLPPFNTAVPTALHGAPILLVVELIGNIASAEGVPSVAQSLIKYLPSPPVAIVPAAIATLMAPAFISSDAVHKQATLRRAVAIGGDFAKLSPTGAAVVVHDYAHLLEHHALGLPHLDGGIQDRTSVVVIPARTTMNAVLLWMWGCGGSYTVAHAAGAAPGAAAVTAPPPAMLAAAATAGAGTKMALRSVGRIVPCRYPYGAAGAPAAHSKRQFSSYPDDACLCSSAWSNVSMVLRAPLDLSPGTQLRFQTRTDASEGDFPVYIVTLSTATHSKAFNDVCTWRWTADHAAREQITHAEAKRRGIE